jgi:inhibitor of cysteine peptidase
MRKSIFTRNGGPSMKHTKHWLFYVFVLLGLLLVKCSKPTEVREEITNEATVDTVEILIRGEVPKQVQVKINGSLSDSCTKIHEVKTDRTNDEFQVNISTIRTIGVECADAIVPFDETVSLPVYNLPAGVYQVTILGSNQVTDSFEFLEDNFPQQESTVTDARVTSINISSDIYSGWVVVTLTGNLKDPCTSMEGIKYEKEGETFILTVMTSREADTMCNSQALVPFEETIEIDITDMEPGEYTIDAQGVTAILKLPPDE